MNLMTQYAFSLLHIPYLWNGKTVAGFDCSGVVCEILRAFGKIDHNSYGSQMLFDKFNPLWPRRPFTESCLLFFGHDLKSIDHVAYAISDTLMVEAGSGDHTTLSLAMAIKQNAYVRVRPIRHRIDYLACLQIP